MNIQLHKNARTPPAIRLELQSQPEAVTYVERLQDKSAASAGGGFLTRLIDKTPFTITLGPHR